MAIEADHKGQGDEEQDLEKGAITGRYSIPRQGREERPWLEAHSLKFVQKLTKVT